MLIYTAKKRPYGHAPPPPAQPQQVCEPTEAEQRAAAHAARQHHQATAPRLVVPEDTATADETAPGLSVPENFSGTKESAPRQSGPADDPMGTGLPDWLQPFEPEETDADGDPTGTGQEATAEPSANDATRAMAFRMVNTGRQAEGLPPLKKPRVHLTRGTGESSSVNDPVEISIPGELREKFDLARSDHNSLFAHPVRCMDPLRSILHRIYSQHAPTKLSRVDEILSKHEGHGQLLLCALIL